MNRSRWLMVGADFIPHGGTEAPNYRLARYLAARGEVHLVAHGAWPDLTSLSTVTFHRVWRPFGWQFLGHSCLSLIGQRVWRQLSSRGIHAIVNGGNCPIGDVNWVHYVHAAYTPVIAGSMVRRAKGSLFHQRDLADERRALRRARVVVCNSRRTQADVVERLGVESSRTHVVYYGTDPAAFAPVTDAERTAAKQALGLSPDRPTVGFVGALGDRRKAFDSVFRAWGTLCRRTDWDADLLVAGGGGELSAWRRRARDTGLEERVRFTGYRRDMPTVFGALDALVHPARYEAYGLGVHESLCRGVPALVSASAGVAEQYPQDLSDLLIADADNPGEIAERLLAWRRDIARFRERVAPVSASLRARTWDGMAAEVATLVERAGAPG